MNKDTGNTLKLTCILAVAVLAMAAVFLIPPVAQDRGYSHFADRRQFLGIPNFWNILSNIPFIVIGILGIKRALSPSLKGGLAGCREIYLVFFSGVFLVGIGSAYYHVSPSNKSLVWDRLPMTVAFMAFFSIVIAENISVPAGKRLLWPLVIVGILSIVYWYITERAGRGDLRPYAIVQFLPIMLIPIILCLFRSRLTGSGYIWITLGAYAAAKSAEVLDLSIYNVSGAISGHSVKHLLAAAGIFSFYLALSHRRVREESIPSGRE